MSPESVSQLCWNQCREEVPFPKRNYLPIKQLLFGRLVQAYEKLVKKNVKESGFTLEALGRKRNQDGLWDLPMKQGNEEFGTGVPKQDLNGEMLRLGGGNTVGRKKGRKGQKAPGK